jgi:hypothetical protein
MCCQSGLPPDPAFIAACRCASAHSSRRAGLICRPRSRQSWHRTDPSTQSTRATSPPHPKQRRFQSSHEPKLAPALMSPQSRPEVAAAGPQRRLSVIYLQAVNGSPITSTGGRPPNPGDARRRRLLDPYGQAEEAQHGRTDSPHAAPLRVLPSEDTSSAMPCGGAAAAGGSAAFRTYAVTAGCPLPRWACGAADGQDTFAGAGVRPRTGRMRAKDAAAPLSLPRSSVTIPPSRRTSRRHDPSRRCHSPNPEGFRHRLRCGSTTP